MDHSGGEIGSALEGALLVGAEGTFLGVILRNRHNGISLANPYGAHGSRYAPDSIFNPYGAHGSRYSEASPFHPTTLTPPRIMQRGRFLGYLTVNRALRPRIDPHALTDWMGRTVPPGAASG